MVRQSDRQYGGLSPDLIIEQCYMGTIKTSGGLTRGSGFTENMCNIWVLSRAACARVNESMQELTNMYQIIGEQNRDIAPSRQSRDYKDLKILNAA